MDKSEEKNSKNQRESTPEFDNMKNQLPNEY